MPLFQFAVTHQHYHNNEGIADLKKEVVELKQGIQTLIGKVIKMSAQLDKLTQEVSETNTVIDSAIALLSSLSDQIRNLKDDPAKLEQLANDLDAKQTELANAVAANTPSA